MAESKRSSPSDQDSILPPVVNGELGSVVGLAILEKKTNPPKPYTEGALIEDMANCSKYVDDPKFRKTLKAVSGLGTAATRAAIIEDLKKHGLLSANRGRITSTEKGQGLIQYLPPELYDIARTAVWEAELDLIAGGQGNQASFEAELLSEVTRYVAILKQSPAMPAGAGADNPGPATNGKPSSSTARGSRTGQSGPGPSAGGVHRTAPTEKQLDYAGKLAARLKIEVPKSVRMDFEACRDFIDKYSGATPPSEKALSFAESIAKRKAIAIPDKIKKNSKDLSAWIDANKS